MKTILTILLVLITSMHATGQNQHSVLLDGVNDRVSIPGFAINQAEGLTMMCWVKLLSISSTPDVIIDFSDGTSSSLQRYYLAYESTVVKFLSEGPESIQVSLAASYSMQAGSWTHLAATYDSTMNIVKVYVNGIEEGSMAAGNNIQVTLNPTGNKIIGARFTNEYNADAHIDEVSIWNTALSQSDIINYMSCPIDTLSTELLGYWKFDEGAGLIAYDASNNTDGVLLDGVMWSSDVAPMVCNPIDSLNTLGLEIDSFNLFLNSPGINGLILTDENGICWKITVNMLGDLQTNQVFCPN